jgi:mannose-6-phosphate isomerase-like protein (cupin superfamily)
MDWLDILSDVAGRTRQQGQSSMWQSHLATAKLVSKPWGTERWLVPEGSAFGFKVITVRAGERTSLQYHREKEEANLIVRGEGRLFLADGVGTPLEAHALAPGHIAHIRPGVVHRVEAVTDLVIVEVSTPQLDDVVRIEDDMGRRDGRIEAEHRVI